MVFNLGALRSATRSFLSPAPLQVWENEWVKWWKFCEIHDFMTCEIHVFSCEIHDLVRSSRGHVFHKSWISQNFFVKYMCFFVKYMTCEIHDLWNKWPPQKNHVQKWDGKKSAPYMRVLGAKNFTTLEGTSSELQNLPSYDGGTDRLFCVHKGIFRVL